MDNLLCSSDPNLSVTSRSAARYSCCIAITHITQHHTSSRLGRRKRVTARVHSSVLALGGMRCRARSSVQLTLLALRALTCDGGKNTHARTGRARGTQHGGLPLCHRHPANPIDRARARVRTASIRHCASPSHATQNTTHHTEPQRSVVVVVVLARNQIEIDVA